ncbi:hypothetical protein K504DRAFT_378645 [Pleomassaria siparia CBS 279.74]|uniref:Uncharacterized protein n=1 Tax=Pleomassaria siparia CBS 279.74 TaxID=1314801 RepID=A0A6G1K8T8_9PLEO|nr:hypothetical protein K504DRAFT_378645 [Pleomassaria siparia CBS 279.74]
MSLLKLAVLASLPFLALGARQKRATTDSFALYGYGDKLGGPPFFYANGFAFIGDPSLSNSSDAAAVTCKFLTNSDNTFHGSPNATTNSTAPTWSNVTLFVPGPSSTDKRVGFLDSSNSTNSSAITGSFIFYGSTAMVKGTDGSLETLWTGLALDNGLYQVYWNDTSLGQVPLSMRTLAPSAPVNGDPTGATNGTSISAARK